MLDLFGARVGGEVEVRGGAAQHRVAHTAAHEEQIASRQGEPGADLPQHVTLLIEGDGGARQQLGVGGIGHVR